MKKLRADTDRQLNVYIPNSLFARVHDHATKLGLTKTQVVYKALLDYLEKERDATP